MLVRTEPQTRWDSERIPVQKIQLLQNHWASLTQLWNGLRIIARLCSGFGKLAIGPIGPRFDSRLAASGEWTGKRVRSSGPLPSKLVHLLLLSAVGVSGGDLHAQEAPVSRQGGADLSLSGFRPQSQLKVAETKLTQATTWVVDVHTHFRNRTRHDPQLLDDFVNLMDRNRIGVCVSMDGKLGDSFREHCDYLWTQYPDRFLIFANLDWRGQGKLDDPATWECHRPDFAARMVRELRDAKRMGAAGLKLYKGFGLEYRNPDGSFLKIDDPRWDPIWKACGELGLPVLIHTADPVAFFLPIDETNERWEELSRRPSWHFPADRFPARDELLAARNRVIQRHPNTTFIGAHMANSAEDLAQVEQWLQAYPNLYVEFASRISELGRQPYTARKFLIQYQDRVLFGTDGPWPEQRIHLYWRFLETWDEYFPYSEKDFPPQGFWRIYGVGLPVEVLNKIYFENAVRLFPQLGEKLKRVRVAKDRGGASQ